MNSFLDLPQSTDGLLAARDRIRATLAPHCYFEQTATLADCRRSRSPRPLCAGLRTQADRGSEDALRAAAFDALRDRGVEVVIINEALRAPSVSLRYTKKGPRPLRIGAPCWFCDGGVGLPRPLGRPATRLECGRSLQGRYLRRARTMVVQWITSLLGHTRQRRVPTRPASGVAQTHRMPPRRSAECSSLIVPSPRALCQIATWWRRRIRPVSSLSGLES